MLELASHNLWVFAPHWGSNIKRGTARAFDQALMIVGLRHPAALGDIPQAQG